MNFRSRLLVWGLVIGCLPLLVLASLARVEGRTALDQSQAIRLTGHVDRLRALVLDDELRLETGVDALRSLILDTPEIRAAVVASGGTGEIPTVQREMAQLLRITGLDLLLVLSQDGEILGHPAFPGDVGRVDLGLASGLTASEGPRLAELDFPDGRVPTLVRWGWIEFGGFRLIAVAGARLPEARLIDDGVLAIGRLGETGTSLPWTEVDPVGTSESNGALSSGPDTSSEPDTSTVALILPLIGSVPERVVERAALVVGVDSGDVGVLLRAWDRSLLLALVGAIGLVVILTLWTAARFSHPVEELTKTARNVHLGRLQSRFPERGPGELGRLGRFLNGMLGRIRSGIEDLKEAERKATRGEVARQVNHDIRNGLIPIRNVLSHFREARQEGATELATVFDQRSGTLDGSVEYLGELAEQYRDVADHGHRDPTDLRMVLASVLSAPRFSGVRRPAVDNEVRVALDAVSLRRVLENLLSNALDAVDGRAGDVAVSVTTAESQVEIRVVDQGPGIPPGLEDKVFEPFFTEKEGGTGLGLPIVRRLVSDVGGTVHLETVENGGASVIVRLPAVAPSNAPS